MEYYRKMVQETVKAHLDIQKERNNREKRSEGLGRDL